MTTFKTGNPVPSTAVRDLYDNAENFDTAVNGLGLTWLDRLGRARKSWSGVEKDAADFVAESGQAIAEFIVEGEEAINRVIGFTYRGEWAPATQYQPKDVVRVDGLEYITMTAHTSSATFTADAALWSLYTGISRAELAAPTGSGLLGFSQFGPSAKARTTQEKLRDAVSINDYQGAYDVALVSALATLEQAKVPANVSQITVAAAQSIAILARLNMVAAEGPLDLLLAPGVHQTSSADALARIGQNQNIALIGADPIAAVMASVVQVTGSARNWSVTYETNTNQAVVGQALRISDMPGGTEYFQATPVRRPVDGELAVGFNRMGSITTSGLTCTLSTGNQEANLAVGDLVHIAGQTRVVTSLSSAPARTFTINAPLDFDVTGLQWWRYTLPSSGTVSTSGRSTTVTASAGGLTTRANVGDVLLADGVMTQITAIANDTTLTVNPAVNFAAGTFYTIVRSSVLHEGTFPIIGVNGTQITVRNRSNARPALAGVVAGAPLQIIRTVLKQNGTGPGFNIMPGGVLREMRNIALMGPGTSTPVGIAFNEAGKAYNQGSGLAILGDNCAIIEWGTAVQMSSGGVIFGWKQHFNNNLNGGVNGSDGSFAYLREAVIGQCGGIGLFLSGGYARISQARFIGCGLQGIRQDVGSGAYGDSCYAWGNGSHGVMGVNRSGIQFADGYSMCNGGNGLNQQNGAGGRFSRTLFGCNTLHNVSVIGSHEVECSQGWFTGARTGQSGFVVSRGSAIAVDGASTGNGATGTYTLEGGELHAFNIHITKNGTNGARSDSKAETYSLGGRISGNVAADVSTLGGTVTTELNPHGTYQQGAVFTDSPTIAVDAVHTRRLGNAAFGLDYWSSNSNTIVGALRGRAGAGGGNMSLWAGVGVTVLQNTVLTGTTGAAGDLTVSVTTDGILYVENRATTSRNFSYFLKGNIQQ